MPQKCIGNEIFCMQQARQTKLYLRKANFLCRLKRLDGRKKLLGLSRHPFTSSIFVHFGSPALKAQT
jgi:hypothetical protein